MPTISRLGKARNHPDTAVFIYESAADDRRPANSTISSPGGWSTTTRRDT